jgi:hypothetical protein
MNMMNEDQVRTAPLVRAEPAGAAISWGAILGGAAAASALSLILLALGFGLGLSSISPWSYQGTSSTTLAAGTIIWLLLTSLAASGLGGYIAGRLRSQWHDVDGDEAHFRDTAHGFLAWAVATLIGAAVLSSAASSMVGAAAKAGAAVATGVGASAIASTGVGTDPSTASVSYFVDMMFRGGKPVEANADMTGTLREARGILATSLAGEMSQGDRAYLVQLVANRTGLSQADAEQRVAQTTTAAKLASDAATARAKEVAETARKVTAYTALWVFVSLLVGAFYASLAATWGGKQRDSQSYLRHRLT